ncbi:Microtubule binding Kinesin motor domain [Trypanosoma vivax]|nr:Microtubule binding Kinesin motor domain [Trypanosoma vivax]
MSKERDAEEGNVTVCVRARPLNEREKRLDSPMCLQFQNGRVVRITKTGATNGAESQAGVKAFTFDRAFDSNEGQSALYEYLGLPLLEATFKGFNTCVFAYGQTGSGKSYSMMGPSGGRDVLVDPGIIPRLGKGLFARVRELLEKNRSEREAAQSEGVERSALPPELTMKVLVSYMEIYQERVNCLLSPKCENLKVREHKALGVYVEGLSEVPAESEESMMQLMYGGNQNRHIASTNMNERSSRSHAIFSVTLIQKRLGKTKDGAESSTELRAKVNLVDLAGSERAKSTGAEGGTLREGANINKSLTVLGLVISALADISKSKSDAGSRKHVPYRDSALTFILKESLGGNSKTFMLSTLSPAAANYDETLSTLRYADRAKAIVTRAVVNASAGDKKIRELEEEVRQLKEKMRHYQELVMRGGVGLEALSPRNLNISMPTDMEQRNLLEETESNLFASTPRRGHDAALLAYKIYQSEEVMKRLTEAEGAPNASASLPQISHDMPTIKINRNDPFLLNVDGVGDWVVEHLVAGTTYLGTASEAPEEGARCITVSGDGTAGVAPLHCCFLRRADGRVLLRPLGGHLTYIDVSAKPITMDVLLVSGNVICIGEEFLQFRFTDPETSPMTARRRPMRSPMATETEPPPPPPPPPEVVRHAVVPPPVMAPSTSSGVPPIVPMLQLNKIVETPQNNGAAATIAACHKDPAAEACKPKPVAKKPVSARAGASVASPVASRGFATARRTMAPSNDECMLMYRHTFLFLGSSNSGKSVFRENLRKPGKWLSFFASDRKKSGPTFGIDSFSMETKGTYQTIEMTMMELGGTGCFSLLEGLLPTRHVTYVLCFSLHECGSLESLQPALDFILCHASSKDTAIVLLGTHLDTCSLGTQGLVRCFNDMEREISNYFLLMQHHSDARPCIVDRFAVDNINRTVFTPVHDQLKKFSELLAWFGDHAIQQCRNDSDFPNAHVPKRLEALAKKTRNLCNDGKWCLSSVEFKTIARVVDSRYGQNMHELHHHMQLLASWGVLHHHYRHLTMRKYVMVDVPWVQRVMAVLSCCTNIVPKHVVNTTADRSTSLLLCRDLVQSMAATLPFDGDAVLTSDVYGLLLQGIMTMRTVAALFTGVLAEKNFGLRQLPGLLELFRSYDFIIMGSRLQYSFYNNGVGLGTCRLSGSVGSISALQMQQIMGDVTVGSSVEEREAGAAQQTARGTPEAFVIVPACFFSKTSSALCTYLSHFLFGPFYRFTLEMVPHNFFSRVVCRVAHCAKKIYLGPATARLVDLEDVLADGTGAQGTARGSNTNNKGTSTIVHKSQFWDSTAWVINSSTSRALLRMVHRSLLVTFHDFVDSKQFYDGLRHVIRNIIYESPGVVCQESILCTDGVLEEDQLVDLQHSDLVYWSPVDENINSLEKIREREAMALMTARGITARGPPRRPAARPVQLDDSAQGSEEEIAVPFVRKRTGTISIEAAVGRVSSSLSLSDDLHAEAAAIFENMRESRERGDAAGECEMMDRLVDILAQT